MKIVRGCYYVHIDWLHTLPYEAQELLKKAIQLLPNDFHWNIVKVDVKKEKVTFSLYPHFDEDPHPALKEWVNIDLKTNKVMRRMEKGDNPPILHRKETFLHESDFRFSRFAMLTSQEIEAGLYDPNYINKIGRKRFWNSLLASKGLKINDHNLVKYNENMEKRSTIKQSSLMNFGILQEMRNFSSISAKTAIHRKSISLPLKIILESGLLKGNVFDWGCGHGRDIEYLKSIGIIAEGWDPVYKPVPKPEDYPPGYFQTVLCIYVINTLPTIEERLSVIKAIYKFLPFNGRLILAVRSAEEIERTRTKRWKKFNDGWITSRGTFQKGFTVEEVLNMVNKLSFKSYIISKNPIIVLCIKEE